MSRKKPERWSHRFELAPERQQDVQLHEHLLALAKEDRTSQWIRDTLTAALTNGMSTVDTPATKSVWHSNRSPFKKVHDALDTDETEYGPIDEGA